jgi:pimeloyl-ACP methyl ester carboxylesterase
MTHQSPSPAANRPLELIFLHYWGGSAATWDGVINLLPADVKTHTPEFRGWGENHSEMPSDASLHLLAADIEEFIARRTSGRYLLVGHSMGGKVAQIIAGSRPANLAGLMLVAPAPPTAMALSAEQRETMIHAYDSAESTAFVLDNVLTVGGLPHAIRQKALQTSIAGSRDAKTWWPKVGIGEEVLKQAASIDVPVHVLSGEKDRVDTPATLQEKLMPHLSNARLEVIEGKGHLLPLEAPTAIAASLMQFIDLLLSAD